MYRAATRSSPSALLAVRSATFRPGSRRLLSTAPTKKGTWKGAALRWGLAAAAVYFYNTSPMFADDLPPQAGPAPSPFSDADLPTVDALIEKKRREGAVAAPAPQPTRKAPAAPQQNAETAPPAAAATTEDSTDELAGSAEALEQEAAQEGAFNPETGEINWDCPCLGGMAHGPCGEQFRAAFSCFVYSTEEPKGMDCIEKFQGMQDCFREYPELYAAEIADDEAPAFDGPPTDETAGLPPPSKEEAPKPEPIETIAKSPAPVTESIKEKVAEGKKDVKEAAAQAKEAVKQTVQEAMPGKTADSKKEASKPEQAEIVVKSPAPVTGAVKQKLARAKEEVKEKIPDKTHDATAANEGQ